jgi:NADPH-dependent 2,4-dienoyl-CoA reductase/sulfur reductase-like enzyme
MRACCDVVIVGGGPAGLAAAVTARSFGLSTILIDENASPGGVVGSATECLDNRPLGRWRQAHWRGKQLAEAAVRSGTDLQLSALAWDLTPDGKVAVRRCGKTRQMSARFVVLATGSLERPVPVANWTSPGVMTLGDLQRTLNQGGTLPFKRVTLAGCGPLLWTAALHLRCAGVHVTALLTTAKSSDFERAARQAPVRFNQCRWQNSAEPLTLVRGVTGLEIRASDQTATVVARLGSIDKELSADRVMLHAGLIPNTVASAGLGCSHVWDEIQLCWRPQLDPWGQSTHERIFVAGDNAAIGGLTASEITGKLAALAIATKLGSLSEAQRDVLARPLRARLSRRVAQQRTYDVLFRPPLWLMAPDDDGIIVCPCETVTVAEIRRAIVLGATGANQVKAFTRCGMGSCQGRLCATTLCSIIAQTLQVELRTIKPFRQRMPLKPITLGELASLSRDD